MLPYYTGSVHSFHLQLMHATNNIFKKELLDFPTCYLRQKHMAI